MQSITTLKLDNDICIAHINVRSLRNKVDHMEVYLKKFNIDILCVTETWLHSSIPTSLIDIPGYTFYRNDREGKKGGGVGMYVKDDFNSSAVDALNNNCPVEAVWVEVKHSNSDSTIISSMYRPPSADHDYFSDMVNIIEKALHCNENVIILGDLNFDFNLDENFNSNPINYIENLFCMSQLINSPTRVTVDSSKIIDLILTTQPDKHKSSKVIPISVSDHYMILTYLNKYKPKQKHKEIRFRNYKRFDSDNFIADLKNRLSGIDISQCNNTESAWNVFKNIFINACDEHAPICTQRLKDRTNPWITSELVKKMYLRDKLKEKAVHEKSSIIWEEYAKLRNEINSEVESSKANYFADITSKFKNDGKKLWKHLNRAFFVKKGHRSCQNMTANDINKFFTSIGKKITSKFTSDEVPQMKGIPSIYSFKFSEITMESVHKNLLKLPTDSSIDILDMDQKLLKLSSDVIAKYLTHIFNLSIKTSCIPSDFKLARVTPVYKNRGSVDDISNFRPIAVNCHVSKLLEFEINRQLMEYLLLHNLITSDQSAFLKNHSTQTCLHRVIDDWLSNMEDKLLTGVIFLDIEKCFDCLDHKILLSKLSWYGIKSNELNWFTDYLKNRRQRVFHEGCLSEPLVNDIGVPQGSVLGPILFLLYINDLSQHVKTSVCNMFADDVILYTAHNQMDELIKILQDATDAAKSWYEKNKLSVNPVKSVSMLITRNSQVNIEDFNIYIEGQKVAKSDQNKYLGLIIDEKLLWTNHVNHVAKIIGPKMYVLRKLKKTMPTHILKMFYMSCIQPHIDYALTVWGNLPKYLMRKVQKIQNLAARIITGNFDFENFHGIDIVKKLGWMNVDERYKYLISCLMFRCMHGNAPQYLSDQITLIRDINPYNSRSAHNLDVLIPKVEKKILESAFFYQGPKIWNQLSTSLKQSPSINSFKYRYKRSMLSS